jgi:hypothetical protein
MQTVQEHLSSDIQFSEEQLNAIFDKYRHKYRKFVVQGYYIGGQCLVEVIGLRYETEEETYLRLKAKFEESTK